MLLAPVTLRAASELLRKPFFCPGGEFGRVVLVQLMSKVETLTGNEQRRGWTHMKLHVLAHQTTSFHSRPKQLFVFVCFIDCPPEPSSLSSSSLSNIEDALVFQ